MELMIVVAIIGILSAVAIPKFGLMLRSAKEADVKSKLGVLRSALNIYFAENLAIFPRGSAGQNQSTLKDTLTPKYLLAIPECYVYPHHEKNSTVDNLSNSNFFLSPSACPGNWVFVSNENDSNWGLIAVGCYHRDSKGLIWTTY